MQTTHPQTSESDLNLDPSHNKYHVAINTLFQQRYGKKRG